MLRGASTITLDSKNRITIPTKYREELLRDCEGKMVCTVDIQHDCLLLYPLPAWEEIELKLCQLSSMNAQERMLQQVLLGNATECEMDKNGRLLLSSSLKHHAELDKNIRLVGLLNKFEIWNESKWQAHIQAGIDDLKNGDEELSERLLDLSL
jgi:MraZ protein